MKHFKETIPSMKAARSELGDTALVLDLKTEGRYWRTSKITALSLIYLENDAIIEEIFLPEIESDEYDLLFDASGIIEGIGPLITYNGDSFALPHLQKKYEAYRLPVPFARRTSVDLQKRLRPVKDLFNLPSRKLADIADFLANAGCSSSYESASAQTSPSEFPAKTEQLDSSVFADDARRVFAVLAFLSVLRFLEGGFSIQKAIIEGEDALLLTLTPNDALPFPFSFTYESIVLSANESTSNLLLPVENGSVRFYYPDYKNYEYLPAEGYAVHKSVSAYVAKDRKQKATPETSFAWVSVNSLLENPKNLKTAAKNAINLISQKSQKNTSISIKT